MACEVVTSNAPLNLNVIGPRSVVVPADPIIWDPKTSYEYLTLVASTDFGQAYISKKDVPAGTPLTNTDYWIPVASYNAQLSAIQKQVAANEAAITAEVTRATGAESTLTGKVNALENKIHGGCILLGDSFGAGITGESSPNSSYGWMAQFKANHPGYIEEIYDNTSYVVEGNSGFTSTSPWLDQLKGFVDEIDDPTTVRYIYVLGGTNDNSAGTAVIETAITNFMAYVRTTLPNATVYIGALVSSMRGCIKGYRTASNHGAVYIDGCEHICSMPSLLGPDGVHPTDAGYQKVLNNILTMMTTFNFTQQGYSLEVTARPGISFAAMPVIEIMNNKNSALLNMYPTSGISFIPLRLSNFGEGQVTSWSILDGFQIPYGSNFTCNLLAVGATSKAIYPATMYYDSTHSQLMVSAGNPPSSPEAIDVYFPHQMITLR